MLGASMNSKTISTLGASSTMVPWDGLGFWGISNGTPNTLTSTNFEDRMMSYFARLNYDWKSRYLMTATMRSDGSSRFPIINGDISRQPLSDGVFRKKPL
mgnify:CR=1 FL=1